MKTESRLGVRLVLAAVAGSTVLIPSVAYADIASGPTLLLPIAVMVVFVVIVVAICVGIGVVLLRAIRKRSGAAPVPPASADSTSGQPVPPADQPYDQPADSSPEDPR